MYFYFDSTDIKLLSASVLGLSWVGNRVRGLLLVHGSYFE